MRRDGYSQPWADFKVEGVDMALQVLDPVTAFRLEHEIIDTLGVDVAVLLSDPAAVIRKMWAQIPGEVESRGAAVAVEALALAFLKQVSALASLLQTKPIDGSWVYGFFKKAVFGRFEVNGTAVNSGSAWEACAREHGLTPRAKWVVLSQQLGLTYAPLWSRSPYRAPDKEDPTVAAAARAVPRPADVEPCVQWAHALAKAQYASSVREILREWTPADVAASIDTLAYDNSIARAKDKAREGLRSSRRK